MRYKIFLILFITLLLSSASLFAQETRYRVEVIVLTHLNHTEESREVLAINNYSNSVDFLTPVPEMEEIVDEDIPEELAEPEGIVPEEEPQEDPNAIIHIEEMSDAMADAWRRLRLSAPFRPLQYLSWEQGNSEPFPLLRLHNLDLLVVDDPWEDVRLRLETDELIERFSRDQQPQPELDPETGEPLPEEPTASELLPPPSLYYGLDGTVSLVRKRFLHLYVDMQQREMAPPPPPVEQSGGLSLLANSPQHSDTDPGPEEDSLEADRFNVFNFKQNRQVKTARMEYFDGPILSVLAYITPVLPDEDEN